MKIVYLMMDRGCDCISDHGATAGANETEAIILDPGERVCSCERGEECDRLAAQVKKQKDTILAYSHAIKNHKRDKEFVLFHFNEFVAGRIDIREVPFVNEIRAALDDKEELKS